MAVPDHPSDKQAWSPCPDLEEPGTCGCYAVRPVSCARYTCGWIDGLGEDLDRPDLSGVLMNAQGGRGWKDFLDQACGSSGKHLTLMMFREVWYGASEESERARSLIALIVATGVPVGVLRADGTVLINGPATSGWTMCRWEDRKR
jgi:hypothetical protein